MIRENHTEAIYFSGEMWELRHGFYTTFAYSDAGHLKGICLNSNRGKQTGRMSPTSTPFWSVRFHRTPKPRRLDVSCTHSVGGDDTLSRHIASPKIFIHHGT